jgi:hypothetical protein
MSETHPTTTVGDPIATRDFSATAQSDQHPPVGAGQQATETAGHLAGRAADVGLRQADQGRQLAADGVESLAHGLRRLSTEMAADQPAIASAATTVADQAERAALFLHETEAREMISKVEDAARRQPLIFLGGAFVLGVAAARFLKAAGQDARGGPASTAGQYSPVRGQSYAYRATGPGARTGGS